MNSLDVYLVKINEQSFVEIAGAPSGAIKQALEKCQTAVADDVTILCTYEFDMFFELVKRGYIAKKAAEPVEE